MRQTVLMISCVLGLFISTEVLAAPAMICPDEGGNAAPQAKAKPKMQTTSKTSSKESPYHESLQFLNSVALPPGKYDWTQSGMQNSPYKLTTVGNLGLVDADGNIVPGAADLFNKWGLHGQCGGNNADCIVVNAFSVGAQLPYYAGITDKALKADSIITDYLAWANEVQALVSTIAPSEMANYQFKPWLENGKKFP